MFYYDIHASLTTSASAGTATGALRVLTVANGPVAKINGLYCGGRMAAAGGLILRLQSYATPGTAGSAYTPGKRHPSSPAASLTAFTGHTPGATAKNRVIVAASAQGGLGGWFAATDEQALSLLPNGGANGNAEVECVSGLASTNFDVAVEFAEA